MTCLAMIKNANHDLVGNVVLKCGTADFWPCC